MFAPPGSPPTIAAVMLLCFTQVAIIAFFNYVLILQKPFRTRPTLQEAEERPDFVDLFRFLAPNEKVEISVDSSPAESSGKKGEESPDPDLAESSRKVKKKGHVMSAEQ